MCRFVCRSAAFCLLKYGCRLPGLDNPSSPSKLHYLGNSDWGVEMARKAKAAPTKKLRTVSPRDQFSNLTYVHVSKDGMVIEPPTLPAPPMIGHIGKFRVASEDDGTEIQLIDNSAPDKTTARLWLPKGAVLGSLTRPRRRLLPHDHDLAPEDWARATRTIRGNLHPDMPVSAAISTD